MDVKTSIFQETVLLGMRRQLGYMHLASSSFSTAATPGASQKLWPFLVDAQSPEANNNVKNTESRRAKVLAATI